MSLPRFFRLQSIPMSLFMLEYLKKISNLTWFLQIIIIDNVIR